MSINNILLKSTVVGIVLLLISCSLVVVMSPSAEAGGGGVIWHQESPMPAKIEQSAVITNASGIIFSFGGFENLSTLQSINASWSFNPQTGLWTQLAPMLKAVRGAAVALSPDGRIVLFGGVNTTDGVVTTVQIYYPATNSWSYAPQNLNYALWEAKAIYLPSKNFFYIIGGEGGSGGPSTYVQFMPLALNSVSYFIPGPGLLPSGREAGALTLSPDGTRLWYFGGADPSYAASNIVYEFDPVGVAWTVVNTMPAALAGQGVVRGTDGLYYVYGGGVNNLNNGAGKVECYFYNPYTSTWTAFSSLGQATKYFGAAATPDGRIWAIGGGNGIVLNNVQSFQAMTYSVSATSPVKTGEPVLVRVTVQTAMTGPLLYFVGDAQIKGPDGVVYGHVSINSITADPIAFEMTIPQTAPSGTYKIVFFNMNFLYWTSDWVGLPDRQLTLTATSQPSITEQITELGSQVVSLQENLTKTQGLLERSWETGNATGAKVLELKGQLVTLRNQLNTTQASLALAQAAISAGNDTASQNANLTQAQNDALMAQIALLKTEMTLLKADLNDSQEQLGALQTSSSDLKTSVDSKADGTVALMTMVFALIAVVLLALTLVVVLRKK